MSLWSSWSFEKTPKVNYDPHRTLWSLWKLHNGCMPGRPKSSILQLIVMLDSIV